MALTTIDRVRVLINDPSTGTGNPDNYKGSGDGTGSPIFDDNTVQDFLDRYNSLTSNTYALSYLAAADLCLARHADDRYRSIARSTGGTATLDARKMAEHWEDLAERYRDEAKRILDDEGAPFAEAVEIADTAFAAHQIYVNRLVREDLV